MNYTLKGKIAKAHTYQLDTTLTVYGAGAEAEATGIAIRDAKKTAEEHIRNIDNPHKVSKAQVGLGNVDNTTDMEKPVSLLQAEAIAEAKKAGTDAQIAADNAQESADNAQTAADNAQTAADNAQTSADNALAAAEKALDDSKTYTDGKHLVLNATLATGWAGTSEPYTQVVTIAEILATDHPHVTPVYSTNLETALLEKEAWAMVSDAQTANGSITFSCFEDKPDTAIPIQIEVNR